MPGFSDFLSRIFGGGNNARTPSFVPESVGKDIGSRMGGTVPAPEGVNDLSLLHPIFSPERDIMRGKPLPNGEGFLYADGSKKRYDYGLDTMENRLPGHPLYTPIPAGALERAQAGGTSPGGTFIKPATMANSPSPVAPRIPASTAPVPLATAAPEARITPQPLNRREAMQSTGAEYKRRMQDMQSDAPPEVTYREPFGREKYDYVTHGGTEDPNKRGWKEFLKNALTGAVQGAQTGDLGGVLGGAVTGGVLGAVNPSMGREMRFNSFQLPRLIQNQQYEYAQQRQQAELAKAQQDALYRQQQGQIAVGDYGMRQEEHQQKMGMPRTVNQEQAVWNPETKKYEVPNPRQAAPQRPITQAIPETAPYYRNEKGDLVPNPGYKTPEQRKPAAPSGLTPAQQATADRQATKDASTAYEKWTKARREAETAFAKAKQEYELGGKTDAGVFTAAEARLAEANQLADEIATRHGDYFDVGGEGGWSWITPKKQAPRNTSAPKGGMTLGDLKKQFLR